jgi:hypothetical protein
MRHENSTNWGMHVQPNSSVTSAVIGSGWGSCPSVQRLALGGHVRASSMKCAQNQWNSSEAETGHCVSFRVSLQLVFEIFTEMRE